MDSKRKSISGHCCAEPCVINDRSKDRDKRLVVCNSPGCSKQFHAGCSGHSKTSDKELKNVFFVCLRCENFLTYSADIARKSFMSELENKLNALKLSIYESIDSKIKSVREEIKNDTQSIRKELNEKISKIESQTIMDDGSIRQVLLEKERQIERLASDVESLRSSVREDMSGIKDTFCAVQRHIFSIEMEKRKESFIVRNFPEKVTDVCGTPVSNCRDAIDVIARELGIVNQAGYIRDVHRIGRERNDGRPRLILVKSNENTTRQFLTKSRLLKQAVSPLNKVFIQEDLPVEVNRKIAEMRKKAYELRTQNPGSTAFVKNKKLLYNGAVIDSVEQNF